MDPTFMIIQIIEKEFRHHGPNAHIKLTDVSRDVRSAESFNARSSFWVWEFIAVQDYIPEEDRTDNLTESLAYRC